MNLFFRLIAFLAIFLAVFSLTRIERRAAGQTQSVSPFQFRPAAPLPLLAQQRLEVEQPLIPLALASADFDEDGVADLVSAYRIGAAGALGLQRGNADAMFPHRPGAQARRASGEFSSAPFFRATTLVELPEVADFIAAGDFNADGHWDLVAAARGSQRLQYLCGDGKGNFRIPQMIAVPGAITGLAGGEVNHADGLTDVFVAIADDAQARLLIFASEQGALTAAPESIALPQHAHEIVAGHLDENFSGDVAVAAENSLVIVRGKVDNDVSYRVESDLWDAKILSLAIGDFDGNARPELAVLTAQGIVQKADRSELFRVAQTANAASSALREAKLVAAPLAATPGDSLVVLPALQSQLLLHAQTATVGWANAEMVVAGHPIAALPLRLNGDARYDLVLLTADANGNARLEVAQTEATIFTVTNTNDAGNGSLRKAMLDANASPGADEIHFALPGAGPHKIVLQSSLPELTNDLTLDATTQPGFAGFPIVEISASQAGITNGLIVKGSNNTVRGLILNSLTVLGSQASGNNLIQGNFVGRNQAITEPVVTYFGSIGVSGSSNNLIGGTTPEARNYLWGQLHVAEGTGNQVQGNYVGLNIAGTGRIEAPYSRVNYGIIVSLAPNTLIGGTTAGAGNLVADAATTGIVIGGYNLVSGVRVQGNRVGMTKDNQPLGNAGHGIQVEGNITDTLIGGTTPAAANVIAYNGKAGVFVSAEARRNRIIGNSIFDNVGIGIDWRQDGVDQNFPNESDWDHERKQNYPVLNLATTNGSSLTITGSLNSHPFSQFTIDFYASPTCDPSGYGEGKTYLGSTTMTIFETYNGRFSATLPITVPVGHVITATAIKERGTTSEFSECLQVTTACSGFFPSAPRSYDSFGGSSSVGVGALSDCAWTATSSADWLKITSGPSSTGNGAIDYIVTPNTTPFIRTATLSVNGQSLLIRQTGRVTSVSAASYEANRVAMQSIVSAFGSGLATTTASAQSLPLPTVLGGTTVKIKDQAGFDRDCPIFYVSPTQVNYFIPDLNYGPNCRLTITAADGTVSTGPVPISQIAPAFFSANASGTGVVAGYAVRVKPDGKQSEEPITRWDAASKEYVTLPLDLGPADEAVFLTVFGTGFAYGVTVTVSINGEPVAVTYLGQQGQYLGLQQMNLRLPRTLIGAGEVDLVATINGLPLNRVKVNIK